MKQLWIWIVVVVFLGTTTFSGVIVRFDHFWQAWEFLAAATAAVYNLCFAVVVYASRQEKGEGTLNDALSDSFAVSTHLLLRVSLPSLFFFGTMVVILWGRHVGFDPVPGRQVMLKLSLTFAAFVTIWIGDLVTHHQLRGIVNEKHQSPQAWIGYFKTRAWLIDLPFVIGYAGLICIYTTYGSFPLVSPKPDEHALLVQAFVGGASALEMMIQSAIHGFSELGDA
jgi:hypothetical protein